MKRRWRFRRHKGQHDWAAIVKVSEANAIEFDGRRVFDGNTLRLSNVEVEPSGAGYVQITVACLGCGLFFEDYVRGGK